MSAFVAYVVLLSIWTYWHVDPFLISLLNIVVHVIIIGYMK